MSKPEVNHCYVTGVSLIGSDAVPVISQTTDFLRPRGLVSQLTHSSANKKAWSHRAYEAWVRGYGVPQEAAVALQGDPEYVMRETWRHFGGVKGKAIANLLGSNGRRAVALALLGADVTVVDISAENRRYALELAEAADVSLEYIVADVSAWNASSHAGNFDYVFLEYGILHYFVDLSLLTQRIVQILKPGGRLILHEFHPIVKKCDPDRDGDRFYLRGDYFGSEVEEKPAPYKGEFSAAEIADFPLGKITYWQLGEVVTAVCDCGLVMKSLSETPHAQHTTLPGTYTLVAEKPQ